MYLAASLGFLAYIRAFRSENTNRFIANHTHVWTLMCVEGVSCWNRGTVYSDSCDQDYASSTINHEIYMSDLPLPKNHCYPILG